MATVPITNSLRWFCVCCTGWGQICMPELLLLQANAALASNILHPFSSGAALALSTDRALVCGDSMSRASACNIWGKSAFERARPLDPCSTQAAMTMQPVPCSSSMLIQVVAASLSEQCLALHSGRELEAAATQQAQSWLGISLPCDSSSQTNKFGVGAVHPYLVAVQKSSSSLVCNGLRHMYCCYHAPYAALLAASCCSWASLGYRLP